MCIPRKKKRQQVTVALSEPPTQSEPRVEDKPPVEDKPLVEPLVVVMPCPKTQPVIHVKCSTCKKDVAGVQVTLNGVDLGRTGRDGKTAPKVGGMIPGKGPVALVQGERPAHVLSKAFEVDYPKLCKDTFLVDAKCVAHLVVEVLRYDGQPVKGGDVTFEIAGPDGKKNDITKAVKGNADDPPRTIDVARKEFPAVAPGAYTITLAKIAELVAAQKPDSTSAEVWKLGPNDKGVAKLTLKPGVTHYARFVLTKYTKIQFIGFEIEPSTKADSSVTLASGELYLGDAEADDDLGQRSIVLKNAIKKALADSKVKTDPEVLKVFMTAEFYWRGKEGAYPVEKMSKIMDEMREETSKAAYADWLFVHGTAIGYLKHGRAKEVVRKFKVKGASGGSATSFEIVERPSGRHRLSTFSDIPKNWNLSNLSEVPEYHWTLRQGAKSAHVVEVTQGPGSCTVRVHTNVDFTDGTIDLVEPIATEVFNVALVQKGGPGTGVGGVREAIVYKEDISAIDYLSVMFGKHDEFHKSSGDNRKIEIHGQERRALPTSGARDVLGGNPNAPKPGETSERTEHGLGGGSIFEIDGITFGLEICRDHLQSKLKRYYESAASPGDPKVQVQLIPSWGAFIKDESIVGVDGVLVFNVDGPKGAKAGNVGGPLEFVCPHHPTSKSPTASECTLAHYRCWGLSLTATNCPHCTKPLTKSMPDFYCTSPDHVFWDKATCVHCGAATKVDRYECTDCSSQSPTAGACDNSACSTKPARTKVTYCDKPKHRHTPPCVGHAKPAYYCFHEATDITPGDCATCGSEKLQTNVDRKANLVTAAPKGGGTVADAPGSYTKITEKKVKDDTSPTGKKVTYTKTTVASTPKQTDYFKTDGKVVVYDPLDLPKPDVV
ncbi:MAG TPA: hypothetical protein VG755_10630 [Nannocystaceae bacterium]|nr:hypothetical protein [Nannocystaceae bacterium]